MGSFYQQSEVNEMDSYEEFFKKRMGKIVKVVMKDGREVEGIIREINRTYFNVILELEDKTRVALNGNHVKEIWFSD